MDFLGDFFRVILIDPLTNLFILLATLTGNAGLAVIFLTIIIRVVTLPLTVRQMHSTRMMTALAPRIQEIQKRHSDPRRRSEEQMKLYREAGINPLGCLSSMLLQMPILFALYATFQIAVGESPESLIALEGRLYGWDFLRSGMPVPANFLWLHLGRPDPLILPILVAATTYLLQKVTMLPATDERMRAQNSMMNLMMPLLFGWITLTLPSGLGLYYVLSNIIGMVMQYAYVGGGPFNWRAIIGLSSEPVLPRALEVRQAQVLNAQRYGRDEDPQADDSGDRGGRKPRDPKASPPANDQKAASRRRRYSSGKRRSRR